MDQQQEWKRDLRGVSLLFAVIVALMGFSAALATRQEPQAAAAAQEEAPAHRDPSLAGLSVGTDAEPDGYVQIYY